MSITENIYQIREQIKAACAKVQRTFDSVSLMAVSKKQSIAAIEEAYAAQITHFGENFYQEAKAKIAYFENYPLTWHFLGKIQANKAADIAKTFDWVHSLDRIKIASILNDHRAQNSPPLQVCVQVNLDEEAQKSGVNPNQLFSFIESLLVFKKLQLRGLMMIPKIGKNTVAQMNSFRQLANLLNQINQKFSLHLDTLSMGMSDDFTTAIEAGATVIRIGRGIFGERN